MFTGAKPKKAKILLISTAAMWAASVGSTFAQSAAQPINLSTRMQVPAGDVGIGGFIICGTARKHIVLRALGPSLARHGVANGLPDPVLELRNARGAALIANDNWKDDVVQRAAVETAQLEPPDDRESAISAALDPGAYTAIVRGKGKDLGVAVVEVYDVNPSAGSKLSNISTRALVNTGDNIVIAGFTLGNDAGSDRVVVRGLGPSLALGNALADPHLEIRDSNGYAVIANDNWQEDAAQAAELNNQGLAPKSPAEAAISVSLNQGAYTALLSGHNNDTGVGLVEVYDLGTESAPIEVTVTQIQAGTAYLKEKQHVTFNTVRCVDTFRITVHKPAIVNRSEIGARAALEGQTAPIPFSASAAEIATAIQAIKKSFYAYGQFGNLELDRGDFSYFPSHGANNREPVVFFEGADTTAVRGFTIEFGSLAGDPPRYNTWVAGMPVIEISIP